MQHKLIHKIPQNPAVQLIDFEDVVSINVTSFSVFHMDATVIIDLKNILRMVTSIQQN